MKSYGRAPTFLMMTGYEQVRSIVAEIAGDHEAAQRVELVLPETGVCSAPGPALAVSNAADGPAVHNESACCRADETGQCPRRGRMWMWSSLEHAPGDQLLF